MDKQKDCQGEYNEAIGIEKEDYVSVGRSKDQSGKTEKSWYSIIVNLKYSEEELRHNLYVADF